MKSVEKRDGATVDALAGLDRHFSVFDTVSDALGSGA